MATNVEKYSHSCAMGWSCVPVDTLQRFLANGKCPSTSFGKPETPSPKKPAEVFRKYLISAMKLPDSHHVSVVRVGEWDKGVQVPASPDTTPQPSVRVVVENPKELLFTLQRKFIQSSSQEPTEP
ncbi:hypothetical protein NQZ68_004348 [Dissostichus eleginoides]|nr:hypothetical protein NQZ68_004348 [Dissostichus eleginoides]